MSKPLTNREIQRTSFVESLSNSLRKQAAQAELESNRFLALASSYVEDGLDESECIELLMLDGLPRQSAEGYIERVLTASEEAVEDGDTYSFQFEDIYGRCWSSYDIGKNVVASTEEDAWIKAEEVIYNESQVDSERLISVTRIS